MSDYKSHKTGFTRSGKSLKAIRRYYAMKNKGRKRSPEEREEEGSRKDQERTMSVSKRQRGPVDHLSKRIAAELRVQQEALEKRKDREPGQMNTGSPEQRPALPLIIQPRDTGPTFVTEPEPERTRSAKSTKSVKSTKSGKARAILEGQANVRKLGSQSLGSVLVCFVLALIFITTWILMMATPDKSRAKGDTTTDTRGKFMSFAGRWMGITSVLVIVAIPYWLVFKETFNHAVAALILMTGSTFSILAYFICIYLFNYHHLPLKPPPELAEAPEGSGAQNPLMLWFAISYLIAHVIAVCLMIKQVLSILSSQVNDKAAAKMSDAHMSMYLSPN